MCCSCFFAHHNIPRTSFSNGLAPLLDIDWMPAGCLDGQVTMTLSPCSSCPLPPPNGATTARRGSSTLRAVEMIRGFHPFAVDAHPTRIRRRLALMGCSVLWRPKRDGSAGWSRVSSPELRRMGLTQRIIPTTVLPFQTKYLTICYI